MGNCVRNSPMLCLSVLSEHNEPNKVELDMSHFRVESVIGQGGFGLVQSAVKLTGFDRDKKYAIKSLR